MLHKDFALEIKAVNSAGEIEGYGATFRAMPDAYGDIILPGAFTKTLQKHSEAGTLPAMLWGHRMGELPIGDWTEMYEDSKGLFVKGRLDLDDPIGQRVHHAASKKRVRGLSIGYETIVYKYDDSRPNVRQLEEVDLWEVSPVNFPADTASTITDVKSIRAAGLPSAPDFEKFLREVGGFSKTEATAIAGKGLIPLLRSESGRTTEGVSEIDLLHAQMFPQT